MLNEIFSQAGASILPVPKIISKKLYLFSILQKIILAALTVNYTLLFCKVFLFYIDTSQTLHQLREKIRFNQLFILYFTKIFIENILLIQNPCICKGFYVIHHTIQSCGSEG